MMKIHAQDDDWFPMAPKCRPAPRYNLISIGAPFLGVLADFGFLGIVGTPGHWYWTWRGPTAMAILGGSCLVGLVLTFLAIARSERHWSLTALGLILNARLLLMLLWVDKSILDVWVRDA